MTKILLTNERAEREWAYIIERVGIEAAQNALESLTGQQRPYPVNIARKLGLKLPTHVSEPLPADIAVAHAHIAKLKELTNKKS